MLDVYDQCVLTSDIHNSLTYKTGCDAHSNGHHAFFTDIVQHYTVDEIHEYIESSLDADQMSSVNSCLEILFEQLEHRKKVISSVQKQLQLRYKILKMEIESLDQNKLDEMCIDDNE